MTTDSTTNPANVRPGTRTSVYMTPDLARAWEDAGRPPLAEVVSAGLLARRHAALLAAAEEYEARGGTLTITVSAGQGGPQEEQPASLT